MNAPDKIYITTCSINPAYGNKFGCWTERECVGDAYIRKDALLEWIDEYKPSWDLLKTHIETL